MNDELKTQLDAVYKERNNCVALLAKMAVALGCQAGIGHHDPNDQAWDADWRTIVFVDLPTGQVSWHIHDSEIKLFDFLPMYTKDWDGHSTEEKYSRVLAATHLHTEPQERANAGVVDWRQGK